jgi:hypothetical protein
MKLPGGGHESCPLAVMRSARHDARQHQPRRPRRGRVRSPSHRRNRGGTINPPKPSGKPGLLRSPFVASDPWSLVPLDP